MPESRTDKELAIYRGLLAVPTEFKDGFGWNTVVGILFCGLVMLPGSIYLGLISGGGMGGAAQWVTVILFAEIARRALKPMNKQSLTLLLHASGAVMAANVMLPGGPFANLIYRAYLETSSAIRDANMRDYFPRWFVPAPDSPAITGRNLWHPDWIVPIAILLLMSVIGLVNKYTLGYFFFRLTSDVEQLPFPLATVNAQGALAMAEADERPGDAGKDPAQTFFDRHKRHQGAKSQRWRLFSFGAVLGIAYNFIYTGLPVLTGLFLDKPFQIIPLPFDDRTTSIEGILPSAVLTISFDLGIILVGMVLPFWAVVGTFVAILATLLINPILHAAGTLEQWHAGMGAIRTNIVNGQDFWASWSIGAALAVALVSLVFMIREVRRKLAALRLERRRREAEGLARASLWGEGKAGRGDYPMWLALSLYALAGLATIAVSFTLLSQSHFMTRGALFAVLVFMVVFIFIYNPLMSYLSTRLLGISGQTVDIPYVREASFIASGARGLDIWMVPIPVENYAWQAQSFRSAELTGLSFRSLIKTDLIALPVLFTLSFVFWGFIWHASEVPSAAFPYAQFQWEYSARLTAINWSATHVVEGQTQRNIMDSQFMKSIHGPIIGAAFGITVAMFTAFSALGLPLMFAYGVVRGLGGMPHAMFLEIIGALLGRYYFQKKYGPQEFLRMAPTVAAGYATGAGLVAMTTIALQLMQKAISAAPF